VTALDSLLDMPSWSLNTIAQKKQSINMRYRNKKGIGVESTDGMIKQFTATRLTNERKTLVDTCTLMMLYHINS
jgi:hypothetical protein